MDSIKRIIYLLNSLIGFTTRTILRNGIEAYWWNFKVNSGDLVTPLLLKYYGFTPVHSHIENAKILSCGSILQKAPVNFTGYIIGSGLLHGEISVSFPRAKILALRGALTREKIGAPMNIPLGDPGLLVSRVFKRRQKKQYVIGIIPHFSEKGDKFVHQICSRYPKEILFIDVQRSPLRVVQDIDKCEYILSSSLHGLVFADSLNIPCAWIVLSESNLAGKGFKYYDYNSALRINREPGYIFGDEKLSDLLMQTRKPSESELEQVKNNLDSAFIRMRREMLMK